MEPIHVTKTFLPPFEEYCALLRRIWETHVVTNDGPLYRQFEEDLRRYTGLEHLACVGNGMLALHIALRALGLSDCDVITTPFTHVGTSDSLVWERCNPVFVDIDPDTLNLDPRRIEARITDRTRAILAVHVYSNPCHIEAINDIARKHNLKVIYDASHAFGALYGGRSIFAHGDLATASFNATKGLHTVEGGAIFARDSETIRQIRRFAYFGMDERRRIVQPWGTNAKLTELCAAMGIVNLRHFPESIRRREGLYDRYISLLKDNRSIRFQKLTGVINYSYMPVVVESEPCKIAVLDELQRHAIYPREYFYPSLEVVFRDTIDCPIAYDISHRVLCLPMSDYLTAEQVAEICGIINNICEHCGPSLHTGSGTSSDRHATGVR